MAKQLFINLILSLTISSPLFAQLFEFENHTNKTAINSMKSISGYVWSMTTGGVVRIDPDDNSLVDYMNSDGLGSTSILFAVDGGGGVVYFGSSDGVLSKLDIDSEQFSSQLLRGRDGTVLTLYDADTSAGFLWIASSVGVIKYDRVRNGGEVKETYRNLGTFPSETPVTSISVLDGSLFAGTAVGVAKADVTNNYLLDPSEWENLTEYNSGSALGTITCQQIYGGQLYFGTPFGLRRLTYQGRIESIPGTSTFESYITDMAGSPNDLFVLQNSAVWSFESGSEIFPFTPSLLAITYLDNLFMGRTGVGIDRFDGFETTLLVPPGPSGNNLVGGGYGPNGDLYVVPRDNDLSILSDGSWRHESVTSSEKLAALVSQSGDVWITTFGDGVVDVSPNLSVRNYGGHNSPLIGVASSGSFSVVNSVYEDGAGLLWFSLFQASPFRPIVVFDPSDSLWTYFDASDGFLSGNNQVIAAGTGSAAIGVDDLGIGYLRYGAEPFNHSDDRVDYFSRSRRLPSAVVTAAAYDRDNVLWVGTIQGLAYFDEGIEFFVPVELPSEVDANVTAITSDTRNNIWVGTSNGLAMIRSGQSTSMAFTTTNSQLVSNEIGSLVYDENLRKLLVFTRGGLSIIDYDPSGQNGGDKILAYPNPFVIGSSQETFLQFGIDQRGDVRIFTVAADLVRETTVTNGWDGRNHAGEFVASGVYIWQLSAEDGTHYNGKVLVVRR